MRTWKLEDAKNYERRAAPRDLVDFLRESPLAEGDFTLDRPRDPGRHIDL